MNIFVALILGIVQGLTEFIPVSSSGHLEIIQQLIGERGENFHLFLEFINLGTLLALLIYFRKRIAKILKDIFVHHNFRLAINIIITTIPAVTVGLLLSSFIEENGFFSSIYTIAVAMGLIGIVMIVIDKLPHLSHLKDEDALTKPRALGIGLAQVLALIPGTSRSGSTIIAGRLVGLNSASAAEYSFLASIPIMCGVCLKMFISSSSREYLVDNWQILLFANVVAFIFGMIALKFVMSYLKKSHALKTFGYYRVILAMTVLIVNLIQ